MSTKARIMSQPVFIPMFAGTLFDGPLGLGKSLGSEPRSVADQIIINTDANAAMVLTQRTNDPSRFGTIADLWDLQFADEDGEVMGGTFVTAFRQGDLLILRQINGDKKVTVDFSAEHAYVDRGDNAVETYADIELTTNEGDQREGWV